MKYGSVYPIESASFNVPIGVRTGYNTWVVQEEVEIPDKADVVINPGEENEIVWKDIYCILERKVDVGMKEITLVDRRYFWGRHVIKDIKNMPIKAGVTINAGEWGQNIFRENTWVKYTIKNGEANNQVAYRPIDLIEYIFTDILNMADSDYDIDAGSRNQYPAPWNKIGKTAPDAIDELLKMDLLQINLLPDGTVRVFDVVETEASEIVTQFESLPTINGFIDAVTPKNMPGTIRIYIPKIQEVLVKGLYYGGSVAGENNYGMRNVCCLPWDLYNIASKKWYLRNDYHEIEEIVNMIGTGNFKIGSTEVNKQVDNTIAYKTDGDKMETIPVPSKHFTIEDWHHSFFIPGAFKKVVFDGYRLPVGSKADKVMRPLIGALCRDYRSLYRFDKSGAETKLYSFNMTSGLVLDDSTLARAASPVMMDFCGYDRIVGDAKDPTIRARGRNYDYENPTEYTATPGDLPSGGKPVYGINGANVGTLQSSGKITTTAPYYFTVENEDMHVIRLNQVPSSTQTFAFEKFEPCRWNSFPTWGAYCANYPFYGASLDPTFRIATIASVQRYDDLWVTIDYTGPGEDTDLVYEVVYTDVPAIFSYTYGWINMKLLDNVLKNYIVPRIADQFQENVLGSQDLPGFQVLDDGRVEGMCSGIQFFESDTNAFTRYTYKEFIPAAAMWNNLWPQAMAQIMKNNIFNPRGRY